MEPIAIVGMACRFPGAPSLAAYWALLSQGRDAIAPVPAQRWDAQSLYAEDAKAPGKTNTREGGFIEDFDRFDAAFFGISPREAVQMDPQQRILLELAVEAFEDAGIAPSALAGSDTAVYVGVMSNDYVRYQSADNYARIDVHTGGGAGFCMLANRLSYQFDLHGPSMAIDSACSSSLVTVFQACQALWTGQSSLALAGGVNLMLDPGFNIFYAKAGLMAPDGRCKTFSAEANGIGRGEGAGLVVLKRESDALRDGDAIYAVIRGGAVNHGGRSNGVTAPNRWAQEKLVRMALRHAQVSPDDLQYVELHGTGTAIGDPIEANALGDVLKEGRRSKPVLVGSVKSNVGHLEGAAGVAGLIKLALSMHHRAIPASLWFNDPNPAIDFETLPMAVNTALTPWPVEPQQADAPLLAAINSFGLGGTNAHLVLASPPRVAPKAAEAAAGAPHLLVLSARSEAALQAQAQQFLDLLEGDVDVAAMCMTSLRRRGAYEVRAHVVGRDRAALRAGLQAFVQGQPHEGVSTGRVKARRTQVRVALPHARTLAPARLAEWLEQAPLGRDAWQRCRELLMQSGDQRLPPLGVLATSAAPADDATSALWCFAAQYALLTQTLATLPATVTLVADGQAQLAAACAAQALSLSQALDALDRGLHADALPQDAGAWSVRCDLGGRVNPPLRELDWGSDAAAWAARVQAREGSAEEPVVMQVNLVEPQALPAQLSAEALSCIGAAPQGFADFFARLGLRCTLRWAALADQRFVRLPSYPWQRQSYLLPPPFAQAAPAADAPPAAAPATAAPAAPAEAAAAKAEPMRATLLALASDEREARLRQYLRERLGEALRMPVEQLDPLQPLNMLGIDSLTAVEVKNRIERDMRITIPVVMFLDGKSVNDFVAYIVEQLNAPAAEAAPAPALAPAVPAAAAAVAAAVPAALPAAAAASSEVEDRIAAMSSDQVDDLLALLIGNA